MERLVGEDVSGLGDGELFHPIGVDQDSSAGCDSSRGYSVVNQKFNSVGQTRKVGKLGAGQTKSFAGEVECRY